MPKNSQLKLVENNIAVHQPLKHPKHHPSIFEIKQPLINFGQRLETISNHGLDIPLSLPEIIDQIQTMMRDVAALTAASDYINSPCLPIVLPKCSDGHIVALIKELLRAVGDNYKKSTGGIFTNRLEGKLDKLLFIDDADPYWNIIKRMRDEVVVALYFPLPLSLQGLSIDGQKKKIHKLPPGFIGSSLLDASMGMAMYPDILAANTTSPGYCCPAMSWFLPESAPYFRCIGGTLCLDHVDTSAVYEDYCGGVLCVGKK